MTGVESLEVDGDEADIRLDRWFRRHFPTLSHGRLEKLLRTGQVRVDGKRAQASLRLTPGQQIRVPPLGDAPETAVKARPKPATGDKDAEFVRSLVIHRDADVIAINKPPGLAVQGGTGTTRHLDAMLDALRFDAKERPRLVHRLDRDTSGVLLLARNVKTAASLGEMFRGRDVRKVYWALVVGVPDMARGKIDLAVAKKPGKHGERMEPDAEDGQRAVSVYSVVDRAGARVSWLALWPLTGRTHQLRVHCAAMHTPIVGDAKYGGAEAFLPAEGVARKLHLHARELVLPHPSGRGMLRLKAELPPHMVASWRVFGFANDTQGDPFADLA